MVLLLLSWSKESLADMYILMGLAGSGKGTQGELLAKKINYSYLSTGEYLRGYITGKRREEMLAGKLISDQEMIGIIESFLSEQKNKTSTILDGFPRTLKQAEWLIKASKKEDFLVEAVIYLKVPEEKLLKRLIERGRQDDTREVIEKRFSEYKESTSPALDYYKEKDIKIFEIDGSKKIEEVHQEIMQKIEQKG